MNINRILGLLVMAWFAVNSFAQMTFTFANNVTPTVQTEGEGNGIQKATATTLHGEWKADGEYLQKTDDAVEGSCAFKLIDSDEWVLMYDCYNNGRYDYCTSTDLENFTFNCSSNNTNIFTPRHGTVIPITGAEKARLLKKWGNTQTIQ